MRKIIDKFLDKVVVLIVATACVGTNLAVAGDEGTGYVWSGANGFMVFSSRPCSLPKLLAQVKPEYKSQFRDGTAQFAAPGIPAIKFCWIRQEDTLLAVPESGAEPAYIPVNDEHLVATHRI